MAMALAARGDFFATSTTGVVATAGAAALAAEVLAGLDTVVVTDLAAVLTGEVFLATGGFEVFRVETTAFWETVLFLATALEGVTGFLPVTVFLVGADFLAGAGFLTTAAFLAGLAFFAGLTFLVATAFFTALGLAAGFLAAGFLAGATFLAGAFLTTALVTAGFFLTAVLGAAALGFALLLVGRLVVFNASLLTGRPVHIAPSPLTAVCCRHPILHHQALIPKHPGLMARGLYSG